MDAADASRLASRGSRRTAVWLGPALIVVSVLIALRGFVVGGALTNQHPDLLTFWLPVLPGWLCLHDLDRKHYI